jgi:hypothetical protein
MKTAVTILFSIFQKTLREWKEEQARPFVGHKIGGCEAAQTNSNTFLIKLGLPITTWSEI